MIIGLAGSKGAGKDTVGGYLIKEYGFQRVSFAAKLKESAAALLDIPVWETEKLKNDPTCFVGIGYHNEPEEKFQGQPSKMWSPIREMSFREFLQRYGTESHRDVFGQDFWVDLALPADGIYTQDIVITDVRFHSEVDRIRQLGGKLIRIDRPVDGVDFHSSEQIFREFEFDYSILNTDTVENLFRNMDAIMRTYGKSA